MTQDEIIEMAKQSSLTVTYIGDPIGLSYAQIAHFAHLVAAKEREASIQIIKETPFSNWFQADVIEAIRARGEQALAQPKQDGDCKKCKDGCPACDARKLQNDLL